MTLDYPDGSIATIRYLSNGNRNFPKERIEVFSGGKIGILDDYRLLSLTSESTRSTFKSRFAQDKGHQAAWENFLHCISSGGTPPIAYSELLAVTRAAIAAVASANRGEKITLS